MPVIIAPASPVPEDSWIHSFNTSANYDVLNTVSVGLITGKASDDQRGLIAFDVGVNPELIKSAKIRIYGNSVPSGYGTLFIRRCDPFVVDEVTWLEKSSGVSWDTPGGDFYTKNQVETSPGSLYTIYDVTEIVRDAMREGSKVYMIFMNTDSPTSTGWNFKSQQNATVAHRPILNVEYFKGGRRSYTVMS